ncbi:MAG: putative nucleotide-diphospho-sugar transferase [Pseudomonadota bacterium]
MAQLARAYAQMGEPADIIASCCCSKFFPLFENWLASCAAAGIEVRDRLLLFTLDEAAQLKAETLGVQAYCLTPGRYGEAGGSVQFADRKFSRTMFYKNVIVYELLALGANVLFQDVDVVWLRDPLQHLPALEPDCDLLIMYDGPNRVHAPLYVNTGFFYARNTAASKALFETAARNTATVFNCGSHQRPFNQILAHFLIHNVLSLRILPEETFPNGHLFNIERGLRPAVQNWRDESYVAHYSWTLDIEEKCRKIEAFGFNYLPGTELVDALLSD